MRNLSDHEIALLEEQGCRAEDWQRVLVSDDGFLADRLHHVRFFADVEIGDLTGDIEVSPGFRLPCGIYHATLHNASIGDHCLIDNIRNHLSQCDIGNHCLLTDIGTIATEGTPSFAIGKEISVLNEAGKTNIVLHPQLTAQTATLMLANTDIRQLYADDPTQLPIRTRIGDYVRIVSCNNIVNAFIEKGANVCGAARLKDCTIGSAAYIGECVILDECIVADGAHITDAAQAEGCFIGEGVHMSKGFSAENCLFFFRSEMLNGEACAALCGPFSVSHHKSTLLIGAATAFYNAGSATNFSNHAYKMGAIHYGALLRGSKTASSAHILWPATIGQFSMVMGKVATHPDTALLPLSYVFGEKDRTVVVPGICLRSVGTWRDVHKWPLRDKDIAYYDEEHRLLRRRPSDLMHHDFPNPLLAQQALAGKQLLEQWLAATPEDEEWLDLDNFVIKRTAAVRGIQYYDLLLTLFGREVDGSEPEWTDICGMLAPQADIDRLLSDVADGAIDSLDDLLEQLHNIHESYDYNLQESFLQALPEQDIAQARYRWQRMAAADADREFQLGDVDEDFLREFIGGMEG